MSLKWLPSRNHCQEFQQCFNVNYLPALWERKAMYIWGPWEGNFLRCTPIYHLSVTEVMFKSASMPQNAMWSESWPSLELWLVILQVSHHFTFTQGWETTSQKGKAIWVRLKGLELNIYVNRLRVQNKSSLTELLFNFQNLSPRPIDRFLLPQLLIVKEKRLDMQHCA